MLVYNFFTGVLHENYIFTFHKAHVKSISWLEDDSGFVSTATDSSIAVWRLPRLTASNPGEKHVNRPIWTYEAELVRLPKELNPLKGGIEDRAMTRSTKANFLATVPFRINKEKDKDSKEKDLTVKIGVFAAGTDGAIYELHDGKLRTKCENECNFQQLVMYTGGKAFFAGVNQPDKPGSIRVIPYEKTFERSYETHVHSEGVTRICISFDNQHLFTGSLDSSFSFLSILDRRDSRTRHAIPCVPIMSESIIPRQ